MLSRSINNFLVGQDAGDKCGVCFGWDRRGLWFVSLVDPTEKGKLKNRLGMTNVRDKEFQQDRLSEENPLTCLSLCSAKPVK
jgi:hypothetical protein